MIRPSRIAVAFGLAVLHPLLMRALSQAPAPQQCTELLSSPTRDSIRLRVMLTVHAFDRQRDLPLAYQYDFGEALRKRLVLPRPLGADAYEASSDTSVARTAHLTLWGSYAATIVSDGHIIESAATGGAHNVAFDTAILTAMMAFDSTDQLSMAAAGLPSEDVRIRVEITARDSGANRGPPQLESLRVAASRDRSNEADAAPPLVPWPHDSETVTPLFSFRVPVRVATNPLREIPGIGFLRFPSNLLQQGTPGQVQAAFVVDTDGRAEPASIQLINATRREFAQSVLDGMPRFRYKPLEVSGCAVRSIAEEPFQFYVRK